MNALRRVALFCALILPLPLLAQTAVSGSKVLDNNGNLLASGDWNFGGTAVAVTSGMFSGTVTPGTETVTVTNGGTTYLTVPSVVIGSSAFNWDTFVVPTNATISGLGSPRIACSPGAIYDQTDSSPSGKAFTCYSFNGVNLWLPADQSGPASSGQYAGVGTPTFSCTSPCTYIQSDASSSSQALWAIVARPGENSTNWQLQGGSGTFTPLSGDASSTSTGGATTVLGLKGVPFCTGFTPTNGQLVQYTTGGTPNPCYGAATVSGSFTAAGDLSGSSSSQQVVGIHSVPLCSGFTPTNGQVLQYTTASSPNPCYTAAAQPSTPASVGLSSVTNDAQTKAAVVPNTLPSAAQIPVGNAGGTAYAPQTISVDLAIASNGHATVQGLEAVPFCNGFTPSNGQVIQYTTGGTPNPCYGAASVATGSVTDGSGTTTPGQLAESTSTAHVQQYVVANGAAVGLGSVTNDAQTKAAIVPNTAPASAQVLIGNSGGTGYAPQTISVDISLANNGHATVVGIEGIPFCSGFTPTNGQFYQYTTGGSPNPCITAATTSGSFTAGGDLSGSSSSQVVKGINSVPLCTGFTPTNGQVLQYTTASSPNPCYTAATASTGQPPVYIAVSSSATPAFTATSNTGNNFHFSWTQNETSATFTPVASGEFDSFTICPDSTGGYSWAGWPAALTAFSNPIATANTCTAFAGYWNGSAMVPVINGYVSGVTPPTGVLCGNGTSGPPTACSPVPVAQGGTATATAPTSAQILVAQSTSAYAPETMGGDCTISTVGAMNCSKTGGTAFSGLATLAETDGNVIFGLSGAWAKGTALPNGITATTQSANDNSTKVATTAYVDGQNLITTTGLTAGHAYYVSAANTLTEAGGGISATAPAACVAVSTTQCLMRGTYTTTGLTAGAVYYVPTSSGVVTATAPSSSGQFVQRMGVALSTTILLIDPSIDVGTIQ